MCQLSYLVLKRDVEPHDSTEISTNRAKTARRKKDIASNRIDTYVEYKMVDTNNKTTALSPFKIDGAMACANWGLLIVNWGIEANKVKLH